MKKLFAAVRQGDLEEVGRLLSADPALVNCVAAATPKRDAGQSPLQVAIKSGSYEVAEYLLTAGADVNFMEAYDPSGRQMPVLCDAVGRLFLYTGHFYRSNEAELERWYTLFTRMLELGADPNQQDSYGLNALAWTASHFKGGHPEDEFHRTYLKRWTKRIFEALFAHGGDMGMAGENRNGIAMEGHIREALDLLTGPEDVALRYVAAINRHDLEEIGSLLAGDCLQVDAYAAEVRGRADMLESWEGYFAWFPDYRIEVTEVYALRTEKAEEADSVVLWGFAGGTYRGRGTADGGRRWRLPAAWKATAEGGRIKLWQVVCDSKIPMDCMEEADRGKVPGACL